MYDIGPPRVVAGVGLGAFMRSDYRRGPRGLGAGEELLGPGETLEECPQPVSTAERDDLRNEIKGYTNPWEGMHFHENHPDVRAIFNDIQKRLAGLEARPKLLRCSAEARSRAHNWIGQLKDLQRRINQRGIGVPYRRSTWVRITEPFQFTVYRGPTYTVRPGTPHPEAFSGQPATGTPTGQTPSSAPAGSVVVNGVTYPSSAAAAAAAASSTPAQEQQPSSPEAGGVVPTTGGSGGTVIPPGGIPSGGSFLEGSVAGIPTKYLLYGALGLLAWKMVK